MPELASPPSLMLACTVVTRVTPNGSTPTMSPSSDPALQGSLLEVWAGSAGGR